MSDRNIPNDQCLTDLRKAREFIERAWCKHNRAVNAQGEYTTPFESEAVAWCALGAVDAALGRYVDEDDCAVRDLARRVPFRYHDRFDVLAIIANFNNDTNKEAVLTVFDAAIADHMVGAGFAYFRAQAHVTALDVSEKAR